ncbi:MAG: TolB family protein, partial [Burkholderiales bacterium]
MTHRNVALFNIAVAAACFGTAGAHAAASSPAKPVIFAPGVISGPANDAAATFSPDGRTVYFFRSNGMDYDIMVSHLQGTRWSEPRIASFSGHWRDLEPAMAPNGSYLIFASSRPIDGGNKPIDGHWGGKPHAGRGGHLWRVDRTKSGWSKPVLLPDAVNRRDSTFSPAIASDGSVYFMAATGRGGHFRLYCSHFKNGKYQPARLLPFSAGKWGGVDPAIAPDQSFIVFASNRPPTPANSADVFIAFRNSNGQWGKPIDLGASVDNPAGVDELRLGPDGHTLYYTTGYVVPPIYPKSIESSRHGLMTM